jgi:hypothetical protein
MYDKVCPYEGCGGREFVHVWTSANGDDTRTQRQICARCSRRVLFTFEPHPHAGDLTLWPSDNFPLEE